MTHPDPIIAALQARVALLEARFGIHAAPVDKRARATVGAILDVVALEYGVSVRALLGRGRQRHVVTARQEAMLRAGEAGHSGPAIGKFMGERHHTTVLHGQQRARERRVVA